MEMTIDEAMASLSMYSVDEYGNAYTSTWYKGIEEDMEESFKVAIDTMRKYQLFQVEYTKRLRADMVAMLEDLRLDFQEAELAGVFDNKELIFADEVDDLVQQKINNLKED